MSDQEPPYDRMPTYEDIFRERGEALNACLVLVGELDRLRTENATLDTTRATLRADIVNLERERDRLRTENATLRNIVETFPAIEKDLDDYLQRAIKAEKENTALKADKEAANQAFARQTARLAGALSAGLAAQMDRDTLREELAKRAKQLGVACMTHDLTHSLACGHCHKELRELVREAWTSSRMTLAWDKRAAKALGLY
jgi:chromosome segregation ATPase